MGHCLTGFGQKSHTMKDAIFSQMKQTATQRVDQYINSVKGEIKVETYEVGETYLVSPMGKEYHYELNEFVNDLVNLELLYEQFNYYMTTKGSGFRKMRKEIADELFEFIDACADEGLSAFVLSLGSTNASLQGYHLGMLMLQAGFTAKESYHIIKS